MKPFIRLACLALCAGLLLAASACSPQDSSQASTVSESSVESEATPTPEPTPSVTPGKPDLGMLLRVTPDDKAETVTLYLNHAPQYRVTDLGDRVAIDLLGVTIGSGKDGSQKIENPVIPTVRYAQHTNDLYPDYAHTTRVVLDLAKGCTYKDNVTVTGDANLMAVVISVKPPEGGSAPPSLWTPRPSPWCWTRATAAPPPGPSTRRSRRRTSPSPSPCGWRSS